MILTLKLGKNRVFLNFCLCAKFNRFFIILGGVQVWTVIYTYISKFACFEETGKIMTKIVVFVNFSLSAKFNRFFIILGGVGYDREKTRFLSYFAYMQNLTDFL